MDQTTPKSLANAVRDIRPRRVILESRFAGQVPAEQRSNINYARKAVRDSVLRGEAPIASHLLFTQDGVLRDEVPLERRLGINAGHAWLGCAELMACYVDSGISDGMCLGIERADVAGLPIEFRTFRPFGSQQERQGTTATVISREQAFAQFLGIRVVDVG